MFDNIKRKIKFAKISVIILSIIFILMIISNIYLLVKTNNLEKEVSSFRNILHIME